MFINLERIKMQIPDRQYKLLYNEESISVHHFLCISLYMTWNSIDKWIQMFDVVPVYTSLPDRPEMDALHSEFKEVPEPDDYKVVTYWTINPYAMQILEEAKKHNCSWVNDAEELLLHSKPKTRPILNMP